MNTLAGYGRQLVPPSRLAHLEIEMEDAVRVQEGDAASELGGDLPDSGLVETVVGLAPI